MIDVKIPKTGFSGVDNSIVAGILQRNLTTNENLILSDLINSFEIYLIKATNRQFYFNDSYFEIFNYQKDLFFNFSAYPVNEVEKIYFDDILYYDKAGTSNLLVKNKDFYYNDFQIEFYINPIKYIKIEYTIKKFYGEDIKIAIAQAVAELLTTGDYAGRDISNFNFGTFSFTSNKKYHLLNDIIEKYRKINI